MSNTINTRNTRNTRNNRGHNGNVLLALPTVAEFENLIQPLVNELVTADITADISSVSPTINSFNRELIGHIESLLQSHSSMERLKNIFTSIQNLSQNDINSIDVNELLRRVFLLYGYISNLTSIKYNINLQDINKKYAIYALVQSLVDQYIGVRFGLREKFKDRAPERNLPFLIEEQIALRGSVSPDAAATELLALHAAASVAEQRSSSNDEYPTDDEQYGQNRRVVSDVSDESPKLNIRSYKPEEIKSRKEERQRIHPKYDEIKHKNTCESNEIYQGLYQGYLEACKVLHGYDTELSYKLDTNPNEPDDSADSTDTIVVSRLMEIQECYDGIVLYLKKATNRKKYTYVKVGSTGIDAGGLSRQFSNSVGNYIKQTFMIPSIRQTTNSQAGGANNHINVANNVVSNTNIENNRSSTTGSNTNSCPKKEIFNVSPMDFNLNLKQTEEEIKNLSQVLRYYAFTTSRINSDNNSKFSLGLNLSAFSLIVLFDQTGIIEKIIS